jgi:hypothetical protein
MPLDLTRYFTGETRPPREDRALAARAKATRDFTREAAWDVSAVFALGAHVMREAKQLDDERIRLAGDAPDLHMMMAEIEATCIQQAKEIQRTRFSQWGI